MKLRLVVLGAVLALGCIPKCPAAVQAALAVESEPPPVNAKPGNKACDGWYAGFLLAGGTGKALVAGGAGVATAYASRSEPAPAWVAPGTAGGVALGLALIWVSEQLDAQIKGACKPETP